MRRSTPLSALSILAIAAVSALFLSACGKQGEGERCSKLTNGDLDCEDGLVCTGKICCPADKSTASVDACKATPTTDSGTVDSSPADTASDVPAETSDSAPDSVPAETGDSAPIDSAPIDSTPADTSDAATDASEAG